MAVVGITVRVKGGRPHLRGVVLDDPSDDSPPRTFSHLASSADGLAEQVHGVADALRTQLTALAGSLTALVVREADDGARGGLTSGRKARARAEGAVLDVGRARTQRVQVMSGPQVGRACGGNLQTAEALAAEQVDAEWIEAGSAALAARSL